MRYPLSLLSLFIVFLSLLQTAVAQNQTPEQLRFIHIGDPQMGYELDSKADNIKRMQTITAAVKTETPDFVIIPGDFVESRLIEEWWAYEKSVADIERPLVLVPGNHDVVNLRDLKKYRKRIGNDYGTYQFDWLTVIALNSEVMRKSRISASEFESQWQWFESAIQAYIDDPKANKALIITTHRPPFSAEADEPESAVNWPPQTRQRLLALAKKAGVKAIITGHSHTTREIVAADFNLTIYTVGGTARVFDDRGSGYRLFEVSANSLKQQYVQTGEPPKVSVGFMGFNQWTPRLFNFSIRHWFLTIVFFAVALWLLVSSRRESMLPVRGSKKKAIGSRSFKRALLFCGVWYVFFAINMQLDFDELLTELARQFAPTDVRKIRHQLSPIIAGVLGISLVCTLLWLCRGRQWLRSFLLLSLATPSLLWFLFQVMSNTKLIPNNIIWAESVWDKIFLVCLMLSLLLVGLRHNVLTKFPLSMFNRGK